MLGRFDDAATMNRTALKASPDELWIQFDLALSLLASGQLDAAKAEYATGMNAAAKGEPVYDDQGELQDYNLSDTFAYGVKAVGILFDYEGMKDEQEVVFKVYIDGEEDPSWRLIAPWDLGPSGSASRSLSLEYSDAFVLGSGEYIVEMYVDSHLAQRGGIVVETE